MRLLNTTTLKIKVFFDSDVPEYAILSHTWGDEEVSYQDFENRTITENKGYIKIREFCREALTRNYDWVWVDTCCINKLSSAELSEAINSMYRWYKDAKECLVYLSDVTGKDYSAFRKSRWFTRGWTLQELLAPRRVVFFDKSWNEIGDRTSLSQIIREVTNIDSSTVRDASTAQRISWVSNRTTSRKEDVCEMAYCLLGLLGVNMPLLYGEGDRAFVRLQEEITKNTYDHTILAWGLGLPYPMVEPDRPVCLANNPAAFAAWDSRITPYTRGDHYLMTNLGMRIDLPLIHLSESIDNGTLAMALLDCGVGDLIVALPLELEKSDPNDGTTPRAIRARGITPFLIPIVHLQRPRTSLYILNSTHWPQSYGNKIMKSEIEVDFLFKIGYFVADTFPPCVFNDSNDCLTFWGHHSCQRLFRLCHRQRHHRTILIMIEPDSPEGGMVKIKCAFTTDLRTSWQLLLQTNYKRINFGYLSSSLRWTTKGYLTPYSASTSRAEISFNLSEFKGVAIPLNEQPSFSPVTPKFSYVSTDEQLGAGEYA